jgi:two-component system cell cycle response regulator CpdR
MLDDLGCEVICAANGTDALAALARDQRIEILIADINMPGLAGYELAEKAKRERRGLGVILLSGRELDSHGFPMIRKAFLEDDLRRVMKETTGLC